MKLACNNVFKRVFGYDRFASASQMFVGNNVEHFEKRMRRLIYGFRERLKCLKKQSSHLLNE